LSDNTYQVIELPKEKKGFNKRRIGKSEKGVYCAYTCTDQVFQIWFLDESRGHMEWVIKSDINLKPTVPWRPLDFAWGSWILQDRDYDEALVLEENSECDPNDKDVINTEDWVATHGCGAYEFLGFHPYKEIALLNSSSELVIACHLNTSKVRSLGRTNLGDNEIQLSFPYTPCWMGPLPGATELCLGNKEVVDETNEAGEGMKIQLLDSTEGQSDDEGFTPVLSRRTRKQMRSAAKVKF
jgi:hypothetical protein